MEAKLSINYVELLHLIGQLPFAKQIQLRNDMTESDQKILKKDKSVLKKLIKSAPIMSEEEYSDFLKTKKWMNEWKTI